MNPSPRGVNEPTRTYKPEAALNSKWIKLIVLFTHGEFGLLVLLHPSSIAPLPPNSVGKSLNFGNPSLMRNMAFS